ncbi:peptidase M48 [Acinetobacter qingfengensis]|uniref:Uncharacterized protein n=1 Tax=Acinetobacter qingfengensis TaxID=1262585 RepID=A0A1E7QYT6_9GAMM|nr:hypothetical protein [Acinetobacter qingfengensis]KAA8730997.1 peptidase M48 [Acinetobacter qingfengensis]OEY92224.1 hypothetical protein BJI46_05600 [Acinetobacter qingfengensis]
MHLDTQPLVYHRNIILITSAFLLALLSMLWILNISFGMLVHFFDPQQPIWWNTLSPFIFIIITVLLLISMIIKHIKYAQNGQNIAKSLGAQRIYTDQMEPEAYTAYYLNYKIAKIYAIQPVHLYLLPEEQGINALTVGYTPEDVCIILTWGAVQSMDPYELEGLLAHQYQKILTGDYIQHTYLEVMFSGLLLISQVGSFFIVKGTKQKYTGIISKGSAIYVVLGSLIWLLGSLGVLISRIFKFLLFLGRELGTDLKVCGHIDQHHLLNALTRIYVHEYGSQLYRIDSEALTQYCFANALTDQSWFKINNSLVKRINRLRPDFQRQIVWKKNSQQKNLQSIIEKILLPTKEEVLLNLYNAPTWQVQSELPILRLSPISFMAKDAIRPLNPEIRQNMERPDVLRRAMQTATGSRELIVAIFMIRQYREFVPENALVSQSMVDALLQLDGRVHIQVFYDALKCIDPMPRIASHEFIARLISIMQADGEVGLLDCLLLDRIKASQGLLEDTFPVSRRDCGSAVVHIVDALLHVQQINSVIQIVTRQNVLKKLLNSNEMQKYRHITDEPVDLIQNLAMMSGLLFREKLFFLNIVEQCLWSERVITQDELDVLQLLYWRLGFESSEVVNRVLKQNSLLIV